MQQAAAVATIGLAMAIGCGGAASPPPVTTPAAPAPAATDPAPSTHPTPMASGKIRAPLVCNTLDDEAARHYREGHARFEAGDVEAAEDAYLAAIARDPRFCDAQDNLAVIYRRTGHVDQAIALYERSLGIAPHNQMGWQNLGVAYWMSGRLEDAERAYQQLITIAPDNPEGWFGRGQVLMIAGRHDDARVALRKAEAIYLANGAAEVDDARMFLGLIAGAVGDWPAVRALLGPLSARAAQFGDVARILGEAYLQPDAFDAPKARAFFEQARARGVDVPDALWRRATKP